MLRRTPSLISGSQPMGCSLVEAASRRFYDRLPADEDVEGGFAFDDGDEAFLQLQRCGEATLGTALAAFYAVLLTGDPVAEVAVGEGFQQPPAIAFGKLVVVDQSMETIALAAIPDVPDEGAVVEQLAVLFEELVAQPVFEALFACLSEEFGEDAVVPASLSLRERAGVRVVGGAQQFQQPLGSGPLAAHRGDADNAVLILEAIQRLGFLHPCALLVSQGRSAGTALLPSAGQR